MSRPFHQSLDSCGSHIRCRRLELGWTQKRTATELGVSEDALRDWELGKAEPKPRRIPKVAGFLGYDPPVDRYSAVELVDKIRKGSSLTWTELARRTGISADTLANLARGRYQPSRRTYDKLKLFAHTSDAPDNPCRNPEASQASSWPRRPSSARKWTSSRSPAP